MYRANLVALSSIMFFLCCMTSSSNGKKSSGRTTAVVTFPPNYQNITLSEECRFEDCQQRCYDNHRDSYDVKGQCHYFTCICQFKIPCTLRRCIRECRKRKDTRKFGLKAICQREDCHCDWKNRCFYAQCIESCKRELRWTEEDAYRWSVRARCVNGDCICRSAPPL
ncbi:uncharacterized protein LOC119161043 [Rhipicephalus microplus]|uniref:uncharacterized protein LOC119161043 n=1 Tax=Rhipicephalus microplus TaxID=6941 RepID=UPI001889BED5|nr:uncharacterized protein LOC119161043 [Rhipicephalus microplus]